MSTYYWDIGFDLNANEIACKLVEVYKLPTESNRLAMKTGDSVFYPGDQVLFNVFNISNPTVNVQSFSGSINFANGKCPFDGTSSSIAITGNGLGSPGQSAAFLGSTYYPTWTQPNTYVVSGNLDTYSFTVQLTVTRADGTSVTLPTLPDPEMIVGSDG